MPRVDEAAFIHPSAVVVGNVHIGPNVFVGPCAVIRADEPGPDGTVTPIIIGARANVQDGVILHALGGTGVTIGQGTSLAHGAVVHGPCSIGRGGFVGFNSVISNATLGTRVVVMHGALVEGVRVPDGLCVSSMAAVCCPNDLRHLRPASPEQLAFADRVRLTNARLAEAGREKARGETAKRSD
jgi:carbonic anhydrase/acetyltransferase-like protein (isoleucine patch superfamily)